MYTKSNTSGLDDFLACRYGEIIAQFIMDEIARAERRDTAAAVARACGRQASHV